MRLFEFLKPSPRNAMNPTPNPSFNELERFHAMARGLSNASNTRHHYSRAGFAGVQVELFAKVSGFNVLVGFDNVIVEIPLNTTI